MKPPIDIRAIDNSQVRARPDRQAGKAQSLAATPPRSKRTLDALRQGARGNANLLALAIEAARARATLGEISLALEDVFGRHQAVIRSVHGVYGENFAGLEDIAADVKSFAGGIGPQAPAAGRQAWAGWS